MDERTSEGLYSAMATLFPSFRLVLAATALLMAAACSSKNPDALTGMNLDENAAMMDANASVEANLGGANVSSNAPQTSSPSGNQANGSTEASANEPMPKAAATRKPSRSNEVNAARNSHESTTELNDIANNQITTEPDVPNFTTNE